MNGLDKVLIFLVGMFFGIIVMAISMTYSWEGLAIKHQCGIYHPHTGSFVWFDDLDGTRKK